MENLSFLDQIRVKIIEHIEIIYWMVLFQYLESITRIVNHSSLFSVGLVFTLLFDAVFAVLISLIIQSFKQKKTRRFMRLLVTLVVIFFFLTQLIYFQLMKTYYTSYSAGNTGKVLEFADIAISALLSNWYLILLVIMPLIALVLAYKNIIKLGNSIEKSQDENRSNLTLKKVSIMIALTSICQLLGVGLLQVTSKEDNSAYNLYYNIHYPEYAVDNLGLMTYMRIDIQRRFSNWEPKLSTKIDDFIVEIPTLSTKEDIKDEDEATTESIGVINTTETSVEIEKPEPVAYNALKIDFDALIASETDTSVIEMHQYFKSIIPSEKNEWTGKYQGYNLILITAEGFSHLAVDENLTPTLYKLMHEGIYFENFYTPIWGVSTSDGEYVATTGLIPKSGVWSYKRSSDNSMPFALGNQLNASGYTSRAYHDHTYTYYDRHLSHPNMGYTYKGVGNGLEITKSWPESDLEMMEVTFPEFGFEHPFHTYFMTVSGHMFYDFNGNAMSARNYDRVKDLPYTEHVKAYLACQIELEKALSYLIEQLENSGQLDHTLIALSADHYPYGLTKEEMEELSGHPIDDNFELYKNAFILYNSQMVPTVYSAPASSLDILPTLSNLMGIPFDSRLMMGRDLFSDKMPLVIFNNRSFITEEGRYNAKNGKFIQNESSPKLDDDTLDAYRKQISSIIKAKFYFSTKILDEDYYRKLEEYIYEDSERLPVSP